MSGSYFIIYFSIMSLSEENTVSYEITILWFVSCLWYGLFFNQGATCLYLRRYVKA